MRLPAPFLTVALGEDTGPRANPSLQVPLHSIRPKLGAEFSAAVGNHPCGKTPNIGGVTLIGESKDEAHLTFHALTAAIAVSDYACAKQENNFRRVV
jgi:hypothetical protein